MATNQYFSSNGKYYKEVVANWKITLVEVSAQEAAAGQISAPVSTVEQRIEQKVAEVVPQAVSGSVASLAQTVSQLQSQMGNVGGDVAARFTEIDQTTETLALHDAAAFEYEAEKWRWMGQSGLVGTRQYTYGGNKAYHRPFDISYNPMNIHTHADFFGLQGMAELVLSMNGYYVRTRHNDYRDFRPHSTSKAYEAIERIARPTLPTTITGTATEQLTAMRDLYRRAYNTLNYRTTVAEDLLTSAEKNYFRWDMSYAECWWEVLTDGKVNDPGNNTRHTNASNDIRQMLREAQYYNYGGHKNRLENTGYWVAAIREVTVDGKPAIAVLKFRILMMPVGTLNDWLPNDLFEKVRDYKAMMRGNFSDFDGLHSSSWGRFRIKESRDYHGLMDTIAAKIPGLDNAPANIVERYTQYGETETIMNRFNTAVNNAGYYFRFAYIAADASGRDMERRGFNDPYLFVAMNTQEKVKSYNINGRDYRFSYMIPLEMVLRHPLEVWNPYNLIEGAAYPSGSGTSASPFSNVFEDIHWYLTPASFFNSRLDSDAADTVKNGRFYKSADGRSYNTVASGSYIFLPEIVNSDGSTLVPGNGFRMRWPCYPVFHEGSYAFAEIEAMRDVLGSGKAPVSVL